MARKNDIIQTLEIKEERVYIPHTMPYFITEDEEKFLALADESNAIIFKVDNGEQFIITDGIIIGLDKKKTCKKKKR